MERALSFTESQKQDNTPESPGPNSPSYIANLSMVETKDYENDTIQREPAMKPTDSNGTANTHEELTTDEIKNY